MADVLKFLNDNAGAFNLLFSAVVAVATVVYARLTASLVRETKLLREVQTEPAIEVLFRTRDESMSLLDIVVKNIGQGPAYDLQFTCSANPEGVAAEELLERLNKLNSIKSGIKLLYPGQEFFSYWTDVRKSFNEKLKTKVSITSSCHSATGVAYRREHIIDLSELEGLERIGTPPLLGIARSIEKLEKSIQDLSSGWRKLKVDVFTDEDRRNEEMQQEAFVAEAQRRANSSGNGEDR